MEKTLIPIADISAEIEKHKTPADSFRAEAAWRANASYARETQRFDLVLKYFDAWIRQRRRTTELVQVLLPETGAFYGNQFVDGDDSVTRLIDFGFTKMQWHRRTRELSVPLHVLESYLDDCIAKSINPSLHGMLNFALG